MCLEQPLKTTRISQNLTSKRYKFSRILYVYIHDYYINEMGIQYPSTNGIKYYLAFNRAHFMISYVTLYP